MKPPKDEAGQEFHYRPGVGPLGPIGWLGENTESDPGSLAPGDLLRGQNVRLIGGNVHTRAGSTEKVDLSAGVNNAIMYLDTAPADNPRTRIWASVRGCFGTLIGAGARVLHMDKTEDPVVQTYGDFFSESDRDIVVVPYSGGLYVGDDSVLRKLIQITAPLGVSASSLMGSPPTIPQLDAITGFTIRCGLEVDGVLFLGLEKLSDPTQSKIVAWNGIGAPKDDLTGIRPPLAMGKWRNKLVVSFDATAAHIRVREPGTTYPGTWNTHALAGFQGTSFQNSIVEERTKTYIASGIDKLFVFDGTNLTLARTIATCDATGSGCTALAFHDNLLHYVWNVAVTFAPKLGRHDPDSSANEWVDTYKDISADQPNFKLASSALSHRGQIWMGARQNWVVATCRGDTKGSIEVINNTGVPASGNEVRQLVRFPVAS